MAAGLICLLIAQVIATTIPFVLKEGIETLEAGLRSLAGEAGGVTPEMPSLKDDLADFALVILILGLLQWGTSVAMRWCLMGMGRYMERDIRTQYMRHLLRLPLAFFQRSRMGDLVARATSDIEFVARFPGETFRVSLTVVTTFCLSLGLMCALDWRLALLSLGPIPATVFVLRYVSSRVRRSYREIQGCFSSMMACIQETLSGIRVVKSYTLEADALTRFEALNDQYVSGNRTIAHVHSLLFPFTALLTGMSMILVLWQGGLKVMEGGMTLGAYVAFNALLIRLGVPLLQLGGMVNEYQRAVTSIGRINEVLDEPMRHDNLVEEDIDLSGAITFRDLSFSYGYGPVLDEIDIHVPSGSTLGVVGGVGAGKTTLGRLIPRLIEAEPGQVLVDGIPVERLPLSLLRRTIGYVPQETFLFSETILDNIALGLDGSGADEVAAATEAACLTPDIEMMEGKLDTRVGERGVTLSGGQKQRTALARALIRNPRILILDDALAAVDASTEREILAKLKDLTSGRTTILIAHRISTVRHADHIVVLANGRVVEQGNHEQLTALNGLYADLSRRQNIRDELNDM